MHNVIDERVAYPSGDALVNAFLARPLEGTAHPAIVIAHEIYGLTPHMEDVARRFAGLGYVAIVPNLYVQDSVRPTLSIDDIADALRVFRAADPSREFDALSEARKGDVQRALDWRAVAAARTNEYLPLLNDAVAYVQTRDDLGNGAVAAIGFSLGGGLVGRLASLADLRAAVIYYGAVPPLESAGRIRVPLLGHYGGADAAITSKVPEFAAAMDAAAKSFTSYVYEGAPHAFFNDTRVAYVQTDAQRSWERTIEFLDRHVQRVMI